MTAKGGRIYLDHAATTPVDPRVVDAMLPYFRERFGNPSSVHAHGRETKVAVESARESVARLFGAEPSEILFTGGGTEGDNIAIKGSMLALLPEGKNHIITSAVEHQAVLQTCGYLEENGFHVTRLGVSADATVDPDAVNGAITPRTGLITLMHVNNEVAAVNPVGEIGRIAREKGVRFHTDTVQSCGKLPVAPKAWGADLAVCSAHKMYGPKGIGALFMKKGTVLELLQHGGPQERGRRGGTENVPLIVGFGKAAELALAEQEVRLRHAERLRAIWRATLEGLGPGLILHAKESEASPFIASVSIDPAHYEVDGETLLMQMDLRGVSLSSGSACTAGHIEPSHVIRAMGLGEAIAEATLRFSFGMESTEEELRRALDALKEILVRRRRAGQVEK